MAAKRKGQIQRRVRRWLAGVGPAIGLLGHGVNAMAAAADPTEARQANRDAIEFAVQAGYSGFIQIPAVHSLDGQGEVYDSRQNQLPGARPLVSTNAVAGESSGNPGFTSDPSQPADQAPRSIGPTGME